MPENGEKPRGQSTSGLSTGGADGRDRHSTRADEDARPLGCAPQTPRDLVIVRRYPPLRHPSVVLGRPSPAVGSSRRKSSTPVDGFRPEDSIGYGQPSSKFTPVVRTAAALPSCPNPSIDVGFVPPGVQP